MKCSFCGTDEAKCLLLIKHDDTQICEHCVMTCVQIMNEYVSKKAEALGTAIESFTRIRDEVRGEEVPDQESP